MYLQPLNIPSRPATLLHGPRGASNPSTFHHVLQPTQSHSGRPGCARSSNPSTFHHVLRPENGVRAALAKESLHSLNVPSRPATKGRLSKIPPTPQHSIAFCDHAPDSVGSLLSRPPPTPQRSIAPCDVGVGPPTSTSSTTSNPSTFHRVLRLSVGCKPCNRAKASNPSTFHRVLRRRRFPAGRANGDVPPTPQRSIASCDSSAPPPTDARTLPPTPQRSIASCDRPSSAPSWSTR